MNRLDYSLFTRLQLWFRLTNLMAIFVYHNEQTHDKVAVNMAFFYFVSLCYYILYYSTCTIILLGTIYRRRYNMFIKSSDCLLANQPGISYTTQVA